MDTEKIRMDFPILNRRINGYPIIYFDNAATSQKPVTVIDAITKYYKNHNANVHRGIHQLSEEATELYEKGRLEVASFIGANKKELVFTKNATEGLNSIMYSWGLENIRKGDKIVISIMEHHANLIPWQMLAKWKGAELIYLDINEKGEIPEEEYDKIEDAKIVSITHASNVLGTINPIKEISKKAHHYGAISIIDSSQGVPHIPIDVKEIECDFLVFTGHKMLGPTGVGGVYINSRIDMEPFLFGGDMIEHVSLYESTWADPPAKFEGGTPNIAGVVGLTEAVRYLKNIGMKKIRQHEMKLVKYAFEEMERISNVETFGPKKERTGLVSFNYKGYNVRDLSDALNKKGIAIRAGQHCAEPLHKRLNSRATARASFYIYNTFSEIDYFVDVLKKIKN
ncbi:SufS family cysteine desulfurase [Candidatus Micrarchaeota archaeon]|nr:SufS family cysteine desulfurase [Candidatus Micrarchaeota archaeon]